MSLLRAEREPGDLRCAWDRIPKSSCLSSNREFELKSSNRVREPYFQSAGSSNFLRLFCFPESRLDFAPLRQLLSIMTGAERGLVLFWLDFALHFLVSPRS